MVYRYDRQLSNHVLKLYLRTFGDTDYVSVLFDSDSCSILWEGFMVTVDCTMQHITQGSTRGVVLMIIRTERSH